MNIKISINKICEYLLYAYIIIIMISSNTGTIYVKGIRIILFLFLILNILKEKKIYKVWYIKWAIIFIIYNLVMIDFSFDKSISIDYTLSLIYVLVTNILICEYIVKNKIYKKIFITIIIGSTLKSLIVFLNNGILIFLNSRKSDSGSANLIGLYAAISFSLSYYLKKDLKGDRGKILYNILCILSVIFVILSASRKAILFLLVPIIIYYISKNKNPIKLVFNICSVSIFVLFFIYLLLKIDFLYDLIGNRLESMISGLLGEATDASTSTRMYLITDGIKWFKQKPWFGYGPAVYRSLHAYFYSGNLLYAHNNYVELLVDLGIAGFAIYYIMYVRMIAKGIIISIKKNKKYFILLGIIFSFVVGEYGLVTYYDAFFQLLLMIMLIYFETIYNDYKKDINKI